MDIADSSAVVTAVTDAADWIDRDPPSERYEGFLRTSEYVAVSDGTRLAADIYLPDPAPSGARFPSVLVLTPYFRALDVDVEPPVSGPLQRLYYDSGLWGPSLARFGYAVLVVEARGAAASFGRRELRADRSGPRDDVDLVDWIVAQPWSNGLVGATGISAPGLAALHLATAAHPAVRAVAPLWTSFDMFASTHPGGSTISAFVSSIGDEMRLIDRNEISRMLRTAPAELAALVRGLRPVDADVDRTLLAAAVAGHDGNAYIDRDILAVTYRDEQLPQGLDATSLAALSPASAIDDLRRSHAAIYCYAGWYDGAFCADMINLHRSVRTPGSRLLIGPWGHGGHFYDSPCSEPGRASEFDHAAELARFFDHHLRPGAPAADDPPVRYFTMGAEEWRSADAWPPEASWRRYSLAGGGELRLDGVGDALEDAGADSLDVDFELGSGPMSRFSRSALPVAYFDRAAADAKMLTYTGSRFEKAVEVTGHASATLFVSADVEDFLVVVYLEDVAPDGTVAVVTDGVLRALFRDHSRTSAPYDHVGPYRAYAYGDAAPLPVGEIARLDIPLFPVSWLFRQGHRIRLSVTGADRDNFPRLPASGPARLSIHRTGNVRSFLSLPVIDRPSS